MGARESRPHYNQWDGDQLSEATGLPRQQIDQLYRDYSQAAGRDGVMDMREFIQLYSRLPIAHQQGSRNMQEQAARIFRTFDRDRSGTLSFDEFLNAIVMMNRSKPRQDRIDFLIRQNNAYGRQQGDDRISSQYGHQVFRRLNDYYGLPPGSERQCWQQVDRQNRGYVTHEELLDYIRQQAAYNQRFN